ncbi:hypothetical protein KAU11_01695, partial [Candidatus Babeliales bacterium]|nr:hypothetical protein [Candidatus Babeliales bacterium]
TREFGTVVTGATSAAFQEDIVGSGVATLPADLSGEEGVDVSSVWDQYSVDLPGESQTESQYINVGDVPVEADVPEELPPALSEELIVDPDRVLSRDVSQLIDAGIIQRVDEPVSTSTVTRTIEPVVAPAPVISDVRTISTSTIYSPAGAAR